MSYTSLLVGVMPSMLGEPHKDWKTGSNSMYLNVLTHLRQQSSLSVENSTLSQNTLARLSRSDIGQHLLQSPLCADQFPTNQFEILERARNMLQLHVLEA